MTGNPISHTFTPLSAFSPLICFSGCCFTVSCFSISKLVWLFSCLASYVSDNYVMFNSTSCIRYDTSLQGRAKPFMFSYHNFDLFGNRLSVKIANSKWRYDNFTGIGLVTFTTDLVYVANL